jgi:hypothetical protein
MSVRGNSAPAARIWTGDQVLAYALTQATQALNELKSGTQP